MENILDQTFWGNTVKDYLISLIAFIIIVILLWVFKSIFLNRLKKLRKELRQK